MDSRPSQEAPPVPPPVMPSTLEPPTDGVARGPRHRDRAAAAELSRLEGKVGNGARNLGMVLALGLVFLGAASLIKPDPRSATATPTNPSGEQTVSAERAARVASELATIPHPKGWKQLGLIQDARYHILVFASPEGPRYSVFTLNGRSLQNDQTADEVYRSFPDLDIKKLRADPPEPGKDGALMLADPKLIGD